MKNIAKILFVGVLMLAAALLISAGDVVFQDGGLSVDTTTLYVNASNNRVGIGTNSPAVMLHVNGSGTGTVARFQGGQLNIIGNITFDGLTSNPNIIMPNIFPIMFRTHNGAATVDTFKIPAGSGNPAFDFFGHPVNNIGNITTSGNIGITGGKIGIGTNNPDSTTHLKSGSDTWLTIEGTGISGITINNTVTGGTTAKIYGGDNGLGTGSSIVFANDANTAKMTINISSGRVGIGDTSPERLLDIGGSSIESGDAAWTVESSRSFKTGITEKTADANILDNWLQVKIYDWNYKEDYLKETLGSISDDTIQELTGVTHTGMMADEFNPAIMGEQSTSISGDDVQNNIIWALQELIKENKALKARIEALEQK